MQNGILTLVPLNLELFSLQRPLHVVFPDINYMFLEGFLKIHPDAPRNAHGIQTTVG
jgi:hypothetical protein